MITREEKDGVTLLRLGHGKASTLDTEFLNAISDALEAEKQAVVLTGTGRIFSAGVDLFRVVDGGRPYLNTFLPALTRMFRAAFALPVPLVAAVNGHAIAGGCVLTCACDHRLMSGGRIGVPELLVSVAYPTIALEILRFAVPRHRLQEIVYSGATFSPEEGRRRGLIDEVVAPEELEARALDVARRYGAIPAESFAMTKQMLRKPTLDRFKATAGPQDARVFETWASDEARERIWSYIDRTLKR